MKNSILKQLVFILAALVAVSSLFTSCKKDNEADDPNIVYTSFDKTLSVSAGVSKQDSLDINLDTYKEFLIYAGFTGTGDTAASYLIGNTYAGVYIDSTQKYGSTYLIKPVEKGQVPDAIVTTVKKWSGYSYVALKESAAISGFAGAGDIYVPVAFRNPITSRFHYGWIRLNLSSDFSTYKAIDCGYNLVPDVPIAMGAK